MAETKQGADGFIEYLSPKKMQELRDQVPQKKGDFNPTISPLFKSRSGQSYLSLVIGPEQFDALQKIELGGKLVIKLRDASYVPNDKKFLGNKNRAKTAAKKDDVSDL